MATSTCDIEARMGPCAICRVEGGKYRCPQCEMITCSLPCVNKHKKDFDCSGIRNKTEFVPLKKMNEMHLLSDYRLLEELSRVTDACSRDTIKHNTRKNAPLPHHLQRFRNAVSRRNCRIYFVPRHFAKHRENTSVFDGRNDKINWRLKLVFLHAQKYCFPVTRCSEDVVLDVVIEKCLNAAMSRQKSLKKHFEAYQQGKSDIQVLLQVEKIPGAQHKMFVLDTKKTLRENLEGKRVVEYPTLYIALKGFYSADNLNDIMKEGKKTKLQNLLISNYAVDQEDKDSDEDDDNGHIEFSGNDNEDQLEEALDTLEECDNDKVQNLLSSLYKLAESR